METPPQSPAEVRFRIADVQSAALADAAGSRATLESLVRDYPESPVAGRALLTLAQRRFEDDGNATEALALIDRTLAGYERQEDLTADARLLRGRILAGTGRWAEALEVYRALPVENPLSEAALLSFLRIADGYEAQGDEESRRRALEDAERAYRDFLERYPSEAYALSAREKLALVLLALDRATEAQGQHLLLADAFAGTPRGGIHLLTAARIRRQRLDDVPGAIELFERAARQYAGSDIAAAARIEIDRLQSGEGR